MRIRNVFAALVVGGFCLLIQLPEIVAGAAALVALFVDFSQKDRVL